MDKIINIWCISDTHENHNQLNIPDNIDLVIHSGDHSNSSVLAYNMSEANNFTNWYSALDIPKKVFIAGNHDRTMTIPSMTAVLGCTYLEQDSVKLFGTRIYGTPYTPEFGNWFFMLREDLVETHAKNIPPCDILVTHGPPKFILDSVYDNIHINRFGDKVKLYEHCGDIHLYHRVNKIKPKLHVFGHIHSANKYPENAGVHFNGDTWFINASCCTDGDMGKIKNHGWIVEYNIAKKEVIKITKNK